MPMNLLNSVSITMPCMRRSGAIGARHHQHGITLIMSLLFLLLLTILGVTAINMSTLQEKMSGNLRDQDVAFQATESALRYGELMVNNLWLTGKPKPISNNTCASGNLNCAWDTGVPDPLNDFWWSGAKQIYGSGSKDLPQTTADPTFIIEHLANIADSGLRGDKYGPPPGIEYYRITARGQGTTPFSEAIMESTYKIQYNN